MRQSAVASILFEFAYPVMDSYEFKLLCEAFSRRIMSDASGRGTNGRESAESFLRGAGYYGVPTQPVVLLFED